MISSRQANSYKRSWLTLVSVAGWITLFKKKQEVAEVQVKNSVLNFLARSYIFEVYQGLSEVK